MRERRRTATSNFGVGARESHDATAFYDRFRAPELSDDDEVLEPEDVAEPFVHGDARRMDQVRRRLRRPSSSRRRRTSPASSTRRSSSATACPRPTSSTCEMLTDVFAECVRTLEPGGRIAVNVANLGRKPYRSLSADVIRILEDDLGLLLRGELIWQKAEGASGSCAWGSFRSATNPVLRDVSERVVVASKGRFDRARSVAQRGRRGLPHREHAGDRRLHGPDARRLVDPAGERPARRAPGAVPGRAARAADPPVHVRRRPRARPVHGQRLGARRRGPARPALRRLRPRRALRRDRPHARRRRHRRPGRTRRRPARRRRRVGAAVGRGGAHRTPASRSTPATGRSAAPVSPSTSSLATSTATPGSSTWPERRRPIVAGCADPTWCGGRSVAPPRCGRPADVPLVVLTSRLPTRPGEGDTALRAAGPDVVFDVVDLLSDEARRRLAGYATGGARDVPRPGFWTSRDLDGPS